MKRNLFILLVFVLGISSCNTNQKQVNTDEEKAENDSVQIVYKLYENTKDLVEYEIPILKGTSIKHGIQKRYYRSGSLYSAIPYVNGKREGTAYTYYLAAEGVKPAVWKEQNYTNNLLNGICKRYHENGTLQAEYEYKNGNPGTGLKEFSQSGKPINQPTLIATAKRTANGYYISARLSNDLKNVDYFIGKLDEGKYLPKGLKGLQVKNGLGEIMVDTSEKSVTITATFATRYRNKCLLSKTIKL